MHAKIPRQHTTRSQARRTSFVRLFQYARSKAGSLKVRRWSHGAGSNWAPSTPTFMPVPLLDCDFSAQLQRETSICSKSTETSFTQQSLIPRNRHQRQRLFQELEMGNVCDVARNISLLGPYFIPLGKICLLYQTATVSNRSDSQYHCGPQSLHWHKYYNKLMEKSVFFVIEIITTQLDVATAFTHGLCESNPYNADKERRHSGAGSTCQDMCFGFQTYALSRPHIRMWLCSSSASKDRYLLNVSSPTD